MRSVRFTGLVWVLLLVSVMIGLRFAVLPAAPVLQGGDKAFPHRPLVSSPYIPRLTSTVTNSEFGKRLIGLTGDVARTFHQTAPGASFKGVTFLLDPSWERILYTQDLAVIKDWGPDEPNPARRLRIGTAVISNTGQWSAGDERIQVFVAEMGPPRIIRLWYDYGTNNMTWSDSLTLEADSLRRLIDIDLDDNGTPGDIVDDTIYALEGRFDSPRVVLYSCSGDPGVRQQYLLPLGTGVGQISTARRIAVGREMFGSSTKEIYVLDARGKVVQYHRVGSSLQFENEFAFGFQNGVRTEIVGPRDITIDCWGQVYVISEMPRSRIYKLTPDLRFLDLFVNEGTGDDQMLKPLAISNSRPTQDALGFDDLQVTEYWSEVSGGQRYAIGIKDSVVSTVFAPHSVDLTYLATDPHWLKFIVEKWTGSAWATYAMIEYDFRFSGTTDVAWSLPTTDWGIDRLYRLRYVTTSTYTPPAGQAAPFADTVEFTVTMGNERPRVVVPLAVGGLIGGCIAKGQPHNASISVQDDDTPGSLTYTWRDLNGAALFYNPSTFSDVSILTGPWSSVWLHVPAAAVAGAGPLPPPVNLSVSATDAGSGLVSTSRSYGVCDRAGTCNCPSTCNCPAQGDVDVVNSPGVVDVMDVIQEIAIAFGYATDIQDPACPTTRGDVNFDGATDVFDVILEIDIAFSGGSSPVNPCGP
jgi:hypothetical protein